MSRRIREGREPVRSRAYIRAGLKVAIPTAMLAIMCQYDRPLNVLTSSITYLYFVVIILSSLRLDPTLCVFTGTLAALGYGALVGAYTEILAQQWVGSAAIEHLTFVMRSGLLFGGGLAAAFVSQRLRTTIVETFCEMRERERVVALFGQQVSPIVVNQLSMAHDLSAESNECADRLRSQPQAGPGGEVKAHRRHAAAKMDVRVGLSAELVALPLAGAVETSSKMTGGGEDGGGDEALWRPRVRRRWRVTQLGHAVMSTAVLLREDHFPRAFLKDAA